MTDEPTHDLIKSLKESPILPVLPLRNTLLFPDMVIPLAVGRERSLKAVAERMARLPQVAAARATTDDDSRKPDSNTGL